MTAETETEFLTIGEVAAVMAVTIPTIRNWERAGKISAIRTPGGHRRFRRSDVDRLLGVDSTERKNA